MFGTPWNSGTFQLDFRGASAVDRQDLKLHPNSAVPQPPGHERTTVDLQEWEMVRPYLPEGSPVRFRSAANRLSHPSGGLLPRAAGRFLFRAKSSAGVYFLKLLGSGYWKIVPFREARRFGGFTPLDLPFHQCILHSIYICICIARVCISHFSSQNGR